MAHALLVRAAQLIEQARALNDEYTDKSTMPAEVAQRIDRLLTEAQNCKKQVEREKQISEFDNYLQTPQHTHQPGYTGSAGDGGAMVPAGPHAVNRLPGEYLTAQERAREQRKTFLTFIRRGMVPEVANSDLVEDTDGELLVPEDYAGTIVKALPDMAVMRQIAFVQPTTSNKQAIGVVNVNQAGWGKLETGTVATDGLGGAPTKEEVWVEDLLALVKIGVDELMDADDDLEAVIREALAPIMAEQEDRGFANGTGHANEEPGGFGVSAAITQGLTSTGGVGLPPEPDDLKGLAYEVPQRARARGVYVGSSDAEKQVALLKDDFGRYLLQPNAAAGEPPTLFGYRWYTNDGLATIAAGNKPVFFGDFRIGYRIVDRQRLTVQRLVERYAEEGKLGLIFKERVGGDVINENALAALTIQSV
jgi:HK97 family phage major capsid protein